MNLLELKSRISFDQVFIFFELSLFLFKGIIISLFPFFSFIKILPDLALMAYLLFYFFIKENNISELIDRNYLNNTQYILLFLFAVLSCFSFFWSDYNLLAVFDEIRYYIYPFVLYFLYSKILDKNILLKSIHLLYCSQIINLLLVIYQFFILGLHPDFCNGIFGYTEYNNALQGIFCLFLSIIAIVFYTENKWDFKRALVLLLLNCLICAFSEIKAYYIVLAIIFIIFIFFKVCTDHKNNRIKIVLLFGLLLFILGIIFLSLIMPENLKFMFNISDYISYEFYGARGGVGRLNFMSTITHQYFGDNIFRFLFGMGIGTLSDQFVYTSGKLFSTLGLIGLLCLIIFFLSFLFVMIRKSDFSVYKMIALLCAFSLLISIFIWNCILTSACFFTFYFLAFFEYQTDC